jgi:hypothetical protein
MAKVSYVRQGLGLEVQWPMPHSWLLTRRPWDCSDGFPAESAVEVYPHAEGIGKLLQKRLEWNWVTTEIPAEENADGDGDAVFLAISSLDSELYDCDCDV